MNSLEQLKAADQIYLLGLREVVQKQCAKVAEASQQPVTRLLVEQMIGDLEIALSHAISMDRTLAGVPRPVQSRD